MRCVRMEHDRVGIEMSSLSPILFSILPKFVISFSTSFTVSENNCV